MVLPFVRDLFADAEKLPAFARAASHLREGTGRIGVSGLTPTAKALLLVLLQRAADRPLILVVSDNRTSEEFVPLLQAFAELTGSADPATVITLPTRDVLPFQNLSPHPELQEWVSEKIGAKPNFRAELPRRLELSAPLRAFDPDQVLIDSLASKGLLRRDRLPTIAAMRQLTTDPASKWLLLQRLVSEEQLHQTFLEVSQLSASRDVNAAEVQRLMPTLPPAFAAENGFYPLQSTNDSVRLGLAEMPSPEALRLVHTRLAGYSLFFQLLSFNDALQLKRAA